MPSRTNWCPLPLFLRQVGPEVVGGDDAGNVMDHLPQAWDIGAGVQHHHHRRLFGWQVVQLDHVAHDPAVVAEPAVLVLEFWVPPALTVHLTCRERYERGF